MVVYVLILLMDTDSTIFSHKIQGKSIHMLVGNPFYRVGINTVQVQKSYVAALAIYVSHNTELPMVYFWVHILELERSMD